MKSHFLLLFALISVSSLAFATDAPQQLGGYVNDYAGILNNKPQLESMLSELEQNTTVEFAVVTISSVPSDETMNSYAYKIFNTWGIGKKGQDNGLLLLMIANGTPGSRMKIEVGYGLEGYITDADAGRLLDDALPSYGSGDYSQAAYIVVSEAKQELEGVYIPGATQSQQPGAWVIFAVVMSIVIIAAFILAAIFASRTKCPRCGSTKVKCVSGKTDSASKNFATETMSCTCSNCGYKFKKKKKKSRVYPFVYAGGMGGGWGGGGFGGGGFGGGASGGGGAGR